MSLRKALWHDIKQWASSRGSFFRRIHWLEASAVAFGGIERCAAAKQGVSKEHRMIWLRHNDEAAFDQLLKAGGKVFFHHHHMDPIKFVELRVGDVSLCCACDDIFKPESLSREQAELLLEAESWKELFEEFDREKINLADDLASKRPDWITRCLPGGLIDGHRVWIITSFSDGVAAAKQAMKRFEEEDRKREKESAPEDRFCDACVDQKAGFGSCGHHWIDRDGVQS